MGVLATTGGRPAKLRKPTPPPPRPAPASPAPAASSSGGASPGASSASSGGASSSGGGAAGPTATTASESRIRARADEGLVRLALETRLERDERPEPAPPEAPAAAATPFATHQIELTDAQKEAQETYRRWSDPDVLAEDLADHDNDLAQLSDGELHALAALSIDQPDTRETIQQATVDTVEDAESLDDLPTHAGFQFLLDDYVLNPDDGQRGATVGARVDYERLLTDELQTRLDDRLDGVEGDGELEDAITDFTDDVVDLARTQPAFAAIAEDTVRDLFEAQGGRFTDIRRADDNLLQQANHAVTGAIRSGAQGLADLVFPPSSGSGPVSPLVPHSDFFNHPRVQAAMDVGAGFNMAGNGSITSIAELVTDPRGAAEALVEVVRDPSLLLEGYKEAAREHGPNGLAGALGFDVLTAVVGAAAAPSSLSASAVRGLPKIADALDGLPWGRGLSSTLDLPDGALDDVRRLTDSTRFNDLDAGVQHEALRALGYDLSDTVARRALVDVFDSQAFSRLDVPEQERLARLVRGDDPYVTGPARERFTALVDDPDFQALGVDGQQARLREFLDADPQHYVLTPPPGTFRPVVDAVIADPQDIRHTFNSSDGPVDAHRYDVEIDGRTVEVFVPRELPDGVGAHHTVQELVDGLRAQPEALRNGVDRIVIEPNQNPADSLYASGARSYMTAGADGTVSVYPAPTPQSFDALASSITHEVGHVLSHRAWGSPGANTLPDGTFEFDYSGADWDRYREAAEADGVLPSGYAGVDIGEDLAETLKLYTSVQGTPFEATLRDVFAHRFALIDELVQ